MEKEIADFIKNYKIAAISCAGPDASPYVFHCFYAFDLKNQLLFFKSSSGSFHSSILTENPKIAGSILPDKINLLALKGIQFTGTVLYNDFPSGINPERFYHKKFPFALAKPGKVWCVQLDMIKMTDNTQTFGPKLRWNRNNCS